MSKITMDNFAVMSVQYVHYSLEYYLDSMVKNGLRHVDLWGGIPHYCRLDYPFAEDAKQKIGSIRAMMEERGLDVSVYTPETLAYPYSFSHPEEEVRKRTVDYFSMAMDDALLFGTNKVFLNSGCGLLDLPREESFARLVDTYKKIAAIAEQKGIELVLEQLQPYESNTLDISAVPVIRQKSHLPVIVDPSHATGVRAYVEPLAKAAVAVGADGLMIEVHPCPAKALSDGPQSLTFDAFDQLMGDLKPYVELAGRHF